MHLMRRSHLTSNGMQGVLYSHRSNYLQSFTMSMPDACCLTSATTVLAIVPMVGRFLSISQWQ